MARNNQLASKVVATILLLSLGAVVWWWYTQHSAGAEKSAPPTVQTVRATAVTAKKQDVPQIVKLAATVYANATVAVKSRLDSQVMTVHFQDGDRVEKGALLFELDNRALNAQRAQLQANLQRDVVQLKNTKAQFERSQKLIGQGFVTNEKLDQDKTAYEAQEASLAATKATLDNINIQMDYALIRAPISGRAGTIAVTAGNTVKANDTSALVTINQIDPILIQFSVPQRYYDVLKAAMARGKITVTATRAETSAALNGELEYIDNNIDLTTGTFVARARFNNADEKLWPGMFVDVVMTLDTLKDALVIPAAALQGKDNKQFVFVVTPEHKAARRAVVAMVQNDIAIVKDGLQTNEQVIADGLLRVTDGAVLDLVAAPVGAESSHAATIKTAP
jgi:multidrug efflux system membrane fusion protein